MDVDVPYITNKMFELNQFLENNGTVILFLINSFFIFIAVIASNKKTGYYLERVIVKLPLYGILYIYFMSSFLSQTLSLLINQRYSIIHSFELCKNMFNGPFFNEKWT